MTLQWTIDHEARLVTVIAEGSLTLADIKGYLDRIAATGAMPYAKLFDMSAVSISFSTQDLEPLGKSIRQYSMDGFGPLGPLAIVISESSMHLQAARYADATGSNRPLKIFRNKEQAQVWLLGQARKR